MTGSQRHLRLVLATAATSTLPEVAEVALEFLDLAGKPIPFVLNSVGLIATAAQLSVDFGKPVAECDGRNDVHRDGKSGPRYRHWQTGTNRLPLPFELSDLSCEVRQAVLRRLEVAPGIEQFGL